MQELQTNLVGRLATVFACEARLQGGDDFDADTNVEIVAVHVATSGRLDVTVVIEGGRLWEGVSVSGLVLRDGNGKPWVPHRPFQIPLEGT